MKILLVRPRPEEETIGLQHVMIVEPLELEVLGALKRPHDDVGLVDMILESDPLEELLEQHRPDVICITGYITNVATMIQYCNLAKSVDPRITTIVGGVHCEVCPADLDHHDVDFRVVRNAVTAFPKLLAHIETGAPLPEGVLLTGQRLVEQALPAQDFRYVPPDRSLNTPYRDRYFYVFHDKVALLKTAFGCPYTCRFCFCREITRGQYRQRPLSETIDELEAIPQREVYIVDDDFLLDARRVSSFLDELENRHIHKHYLVYGRADFIAKHPELIERFRDAGLRTVIVGFESFFEEELAQYDKGCDARTNRQAMEVLTRLDIDCFATIVMNPGWSRSHFRQLEHELKRLNIHYVNLQPLTPMPGTELERADDGLLIKRSDYAHWDLAHLSIQPSQLSAPDYYREILRLYHSILFQPRVIMKHLRKYPLRMLWRMMVGSQRVNAQYRRRIRQSARESVVAVGGN